MFASLLGFLGFDSMSKIGMRIWAITTLTGFVATLWLAGQGCAQYVCGPAIQGISQSHPAFAVGLSLAFNSTTYGLASCYMTVWAACQLYVYKKTILDKML
jgi:hypothetical protein